MQDDQQIAEAKICKMIKKLLKKINNEKQDYHKIAEEIKLKTIKKLMKKNKFMR